MRKIVASLLVLLAVSCTSAMAAQIVVDGQIDAGAYCVITDVSGDMGTYGMDMVAWGFAVDRTTGTSTHGTLYTYFEMANDVSLFQPANNGVFYVSVFVDGDMSTSTTGTGDQYARWSQPGTTGAESIKNVDIQVEYGDGQYGSSTGEGYNYWGSGGNIGNWLAAVSTSGTGNQAGTAWSGKVIEMAVDLSDLNGAYNSLAGTWPKDAWWIGGRVCGQNTQAAAEGFGWWGDLAIGGWDQGGDGSSFEGTLVSVGDPNYATQQGTPILIGDYNYDGVVNAADLDFCTRGIYNAAENALLDLSGNGVSDSNDLAAMLTSGMLGVSTYVGDANLDGQVEASDFSLMLEKWQQNGFGWAYGDFNGDNVADASDFSLMLEQWQNGVESSPLVTPEPATLSLLALSGLALLRRRK